MSTTGETGAATALYRAIWRWHFIAGLLVLPFLVLLAVTGALYLFSAELDHAFYRGWDTVVPAGKPLLPAALVERVQRETHGQVLQISLPERSDRAARMTVYVAGTGTRMTFVDPYDGHVRGVTRYGGVMQVVRKVHSLQLFGPVASWLVEAAAGWAVVLVGTGVFLWWPRGRGGVLKVRGKPRERVFWRDTHAVVGLFTGAIVVFLAITGMPWSDLWGGKVQDWATNAGLSRPTPPADVLPEWLLENFSQPTTTVSTDEHTGGAQAGHHHGGELQSTLPWALEKSPPPASLAAGERSRIDLDQAVQQIERAGLARPYSVLLPEGPTSAYAATYAPDQVEGTRVIYVDQYDGHVLDDVGYARFGPAAKAIEWGIAVHQGQQFGAINRYVMLAGCVAIVVLAVSAVTMWWKRRPRGSLGLPPSPTDRRVYRIVLAIVIPLAIFYPLVGATLLVALAIEAIASLVRRHTHAT